MRAFNKRRKLLTTAVATGLAGYCAYRLYRSDSLRRLCRAARTAWELLDALNSAAELSARATRDLSNFLETDSDEVPQFVRQLCKLLCSEDARRVVESVTEAAAQGFAATLAPIHLGDTGGLGSQSSRDAILEAFVSERGRSIISLAVGVAAQNSIRTLWECVQESGSFCARTTNNHQSSIFSYLDELLRAMCTSNGQQLVTLAVSAFASGVASVYMDRMDGVNTFEHLFEAMSRPAHRETLLLITGASSREAMSAVFRETCSVASSGDYSSRNPGWELKDNSTRSGSRTEAVAVTLQSLGAESDNGMEESSSECSSGASFERTENRTVENSKALVLVKDDAMSPLVSAMVAASRIPEARELLAVMAGNAAREGARGVVHSIPEVLSRVLWRRGDECRICNRNTGRGASVQSMQVAMTVLMSVVLYASTSVPLL